MEIFENIIGIWKVELMFAESIWLEIPKQIKVRSRPLSKLPNTEYWLSEGVYTGGQGDPANHAQGQMQSRSVRTSANPEVTRRWFRILGGIELRGHKPQVNKSPVNDESPPFPTPGGPYSYTSSPSPKHQHTFSTQGCWPPAGQAGLQAHSISDQSGSATF